MSDDSRPVWSQLLRETDKAYAAFVAYRELPAQARSIFAAAEKFGAKISKRQRLLREAPRHIREWAVNHNWAFRARAYQEHQECEVQKAQQQSIHDMLDGHTKISRALIGKALQRLQQLDPKELTPRDCLRWMEIGIKYERLSRGVSPTEVHQFPPPDPNENTWAQEQQAKADADLVCRELSLCLFERMSGNPRPVDPPSCAMEDEMRDTLGRAGIHAPGSHNWLYGYEHDWKKKAEAEAAGERHGEGETRRHGDTETDTETRRRGDTEPARPEPMASPRAIQRRRGKAARRTGWAVIPCTTQRRIGRTVMRRTIHRRAGKAATVIPDKKHRRNGIQARSRRRLKSSCRVPIVMMKARGKTIRA